MAANINKSLLEIIKDISGNFFNLLANLAGLFSLEFQLAKKSLAWIAALSLLLIVFLISTWLSILVLLYFVFTSLKFGWLLSLVIINLLNIVLMVLVTIFILKLKGNLSFSATRRQLHFNAPTEVVNHERSI